MLKELKYQTLKTLVDTIGQTSNGLQLCSKYGFTSGKMLDYIYENQPSGKFFIGKYIDSIFIRHNGWEVIRTRKNNLVNSLEKAIILTLTEKKDVFILDVASGPAKYILEIMDKFRNPKVSAVCKDIDERWLIEGKASAEALKLDNIDFIPGNALEIASFRELEKVPDIIVSSGFYDWITDDELVKKSMKLIYDNLPSGGYFVFTNQSGHVDFEMVSKVFKDFNHNPLEMKIRSADLINGWAKLIGFKIRETNSDNNGYYSVTLAQK
jgi:SAM-dependent methyltransferase